MKGILKKEITLSEIKAYFQIIGMLIILTACTSGFNIMDEGSDDESDPVEDIESTEDTTDDAEAENGESHEEDSDYVWESSTEIQITLNGSSISTNSDNVSIDGSDLEINAGGNYRLSGTLSDGQIKVNSDDEEVVRLILDGVDLYCSNSAPIFIENASKIIIVLADNSTNKLKDSSSYTFDSDDDEPNATLFSKEDMTIFGGGKLTVDANYNDAITSKDGLVIKSGTFIINSVDDGIRGKDYLIIHDGTFTIDADGDGFKSDNEDETVLGYISIDLITANITSGGDAIQAETDVVIADGDFNLTAGGGSSKSIYGDNSAKGIKAGSSIVIDTGNFVISSADDAIHSNGSLAINNGTYELSSGDDGIHSDNTLGINGGDINITKSYEGIESAVIKIEDGTIHVKSSDDGLNVAGGNDGSGMGGWGGYTSSGSYYMYLNGGYIYVNATGDGLDANGYIEMTGGTVIVNGPTSSGNGALDYDRGFTISGGTLIAVGSSGMAQAPGSSSSQYSVLVKFSSTISAGSLINMQTDSGSDLFTFSPAKSIQSVAFSSPDIKKGTTYNLYYGGSSTGESVDGLYSNGTYSPGTKYTSFTVSSVVTSVGSSSGGH